MDKTVLIVEDEYLIAADLQDMLERNGWRVIGPAPTVQAALSLLSAERPAVALLDVDLRGHPVTPLAEELAARGIPFALASAFTRPEQFGGPILSSAPNVGKPVEEWRLVEVLESLAC